MKTEHIENAIKNAELVYRIDHDLYFNGEIDIKSTSLAMLSISLMKEEGLSWFNLYLNSDGGSVDNTIRFMEFLNLSGMMEKSSVIAFNEVSSAAVSLYALFPNRYGVRSSRWFFHDYMVAFDEGNVRKARLESIMERVNMMNPFLEAPIDNLIGKELHQSFIQKERYVGFDEALKIGLCQRIWEGR
jgi:ATP-dependent protease ClpP protease subunit